MSIDGIDPEDLQRIDAARSPADTRAATLGSRCVARVLDGVIVLVFATAVAASIDVGQRLYVTAVVFSVGTFAYFLVYESTQGATLGKKLIGICVLGPDSAPRPSVKQSAIRNAFTLLYIIPYLGALLSLTAYLLITSTISGNASGQGAHDRWAGGTRVVRNNRPEH